MWQTEGNYFQIFMLDEKLNFVSVNTACVVAGAYWIIFQPQTYIAQGHKKAWFANKKA